MSLKNELELELQLDAYAQPAAEAAQEAQAAAQTARSAAQEADTAEQAAQAAAETAETAAAGADAAAETANAAAQKAQQATEETRLATQSTISAVTYAQEMAYQVGEMGRQVQTIGYDAQDAAQEARDAAADARDAALGVWKKADAIIDESAQAASHTLYAQSDYPIEVTVYGTADGICDVNYVFELNADTQFSLINDGDTSPVGAAGVGILIGRNTGGTADSCAMSAGRFSRGGFGMASGDSQLAKSREPWNYCYINGNAMMIIRHELIGTTSESTRAEALAAAQAYFAANPTQMWIKASNGTLCGAVVAAEARNEVPYLERYRVPIALDAPLAEGETASVQIPCPKTITGAVTVSATGKTSVTYAHDTKHYIDSRIEALLALTME